MKSKLTGLARSLRRRSTEAEKLLWSHVRARQLEGLKFRRQQPIGNYVVDFVCLERGLIIELDVSQHSVEKAEDEQREKWLENEGYRVLRFWDNEILTNTEAVLQVIRQNCADHASLKGVK